MVIFDITIPLRTPTLNEMLRKHWRQRKKILAEIAWHVRALAGPSPGLVDQAIIQIHRYTPRQLDPDGLTAIAKPILDVLQPASLRHPLGLGWIAGDDPAHLSLSVTTVRSLAKGTRIILEDQAARNLRIISSGYF